MTQRLSSNRFVGRQGELAELELAFSDARAGTPALILLGGESGVGKTRLAAELERVVLADAEREPASSSAAGAPADAAATPLVLWGNCLEQVDAELPYAPLIGALRPLVRRRDPRLDQLGPGTRQRLAQLLPSLGEPAPARRPAELADTGPLQLFEALLELLELLSEPAPLLLVIEDAHWADRSTRGFLAFLARALRDERLLVVVSYRSDELHRRHPLRPLLAELDRSPRVRRITLEPFTRAELTQALSDILGRAPDEDLLDRLLDRTEGNPLFVEELLAAGLDGRGSAPQSLHDAFMLRIDRLGPQARRVARCVAVGVRLDEASIAAVCELDGDDLHEALREAVAEQVLAIGTDDRLTFRHALLREALYDDLLPGERGELHLCLARTLEAQVASTCVEDDVERIARVATHYAAAGDQPAALRAAVTAAARAREVEAYADVASLLERALELWPRVPQAEAVTGVDHVELLSRTSAMHSLAGSFPRAHQLLEQALAAVAEDDPVRTGGLLACEARILWKLNRGSEGLAAAERALALLPDSEARERLGLQAWLARTRVLRGQFGKALVAGEEALARSRELGARDLESELLNTLGMAYAARGELGHGVELLETAMALARAAGDTDGLAVAYANLSDVLHLHGDSRRAVEVVEAGLAEIPTSLRRSHEWLVLSRAQLALESGEWALVRRELSRPPEAYAGTTLIFRLLVEAQLALDSGDAPTAQARLTAAADLVEITTEAQWHGWFGAQLAELRRRCGDLTGARAAVAHALDELETCTDDVMRIANISAVGARVEADLGLRARDLHDPEAGREAEQRLELHLARLEAAADDGGAVEAAWLAAGRAEAARLGPPRAAAQAWREAAEHFEGIGRPYLVAVSGWREAEALAGAGERDAAAGAAAAALTRARALGADWLIAELTALGARARLGGLEDAEGTDTETRASDPAEAPFGLTPREAQVLALLAQGATNRQIGAALYMAEKTASVHVSRILSKLDVGSRTQAAAVAHRMGLAHLERAGQQV